MTIYRDYDHNHSYDPAIVVKRKFLLLIEASPPKCLSLSQRDSVTAILDSQVPSKHNWMRFQGKAFINNENVN